MRLVALLVAAPLVVAPAVARASGDPVASAAPASSAAPGPSALPDLPRLAPIAFPEPDVGAIKELDRLLERLTSEDERSRADARKAINEVTPGIVPAVRVRVQELRKTIDRDAVPRVLEAARKAGRKTLHKPEHKSKKSKKDKDDDDEGDWLDFLLGAPHPKDKDWQDLVRLVAMERMLTAVGTTPAVRELIAFRGYFGEMLRIDLQRQIGKLHDKAVPALIEARKHDAEVVQKFANKQLDILGRAIPGEAVASNDTQVLADVLRAYGRTRDVEAVRVILSFANSDRVQLREASREAVAAIGEQAMWQLKDQYLGLTGEKPPRAWTWDRLARELFAVHDKARLSEVYKSMDEGVAAAAAGKIPEAVEAFDKVLARSPLFERRKEMAPVFAERARQLEADHRDDALAMMRKALRLDPKGDKAKLMEAEIAYLEGVISVEQGSPDKTAFQRAIDRDPTHERARQALAALEDKAIERQSYLKRYVAAGGIGLAAIVAMILLAFRRPKKVDPQGPSPPAPPGDEPTTTAAG